MNKFLDNLLVPVQQERARLIEKRQDLVNQRQAVDREVQTLDRLLKAAGLMEPTSRQTTRANTGRHSRQPKLVAHERIEQLYDWALQTDGPFTKKDAAQGTGINETTVHYAIVHLCDQNRIRPLGRDPHRNRAVVFDLMERTNNG